MKGKFIVLEGIDGCGKTTQCELLKKHFDTKGYKTLYTREPGGTLLGEQVRKILLDKKNTSMHPAAESFLYAAARVQIINEIIKPALLKDKIVICDRSGDSMLAYQGYGRGVSIDFLKQINDTALSDLKPDLVIILDIDAKEAALRFKKKVIDRLETENSIFFENVRQGFLKTARGKKNYVVLDAQLPVWELHKQILSTIKKQISGLLL